MGRFIREQMEREGVALDGIVTDPQRLTALVLLAVENVATFPLLFYRENCADMALGEADIDPGVRGAGRRRAGHRHAFFHRHHGCGATQSHGPRQSKAAPG